ncbi:hypothetical protein BJF78_22205 [Pseudonocardia sp. CNS-139]|nr:hypothetical protein BJF78_22205 [Pseudonocardia sp. CNS-139]
MKTHAEIDLDSSAALETVAYEGELRMEFDSGGTCLVLCLTEDLVQKLSVLLPVAVDELRYVRENPRYEHRLVVAPS